MDRHIWFGTRDYMRWIPAPAVANYAGGAANWSTRQNYLNGGAYVRNSFGSHREYSLSWNLRSQAELNPIVDFAQGMYGTGLIYWVDPFATYTNVFPKDWATPYLGALDGVNIADTADRPTLVPTSANPHGFPTQSAVFTGVPNGTNKSAWIPIPPGHDLIVRAYGSENGGIIRFVARQDGVSTQIGWNEVTDISNGGRRFNGGPTGSWVEVFLNTGAPTATAIVTGLMGRIVKEGESGAFDRFYSGQGNSGCRFEGMPQSSPYSAVMDKIGMSAKLVEVGAWL